MQKNEVIDLRTYRVEDDATDQNDNAAAMDELPAGTKILHGQYTITGYLNSGGFGITYRATDSLGRNVVIKECFPAVMCYRAGKDVKVRSRSHAQEFGAMVTNFVKEAHALAAMDHKNIVRVHQVFEENETAYMAIDFVDGMDMLDVIEHDPKRLGPQEIEALTRKILHAIKYVHDRGMLHRDISPDNILLDEANEPILIDFGSAREKAKQSGRVMSRLKFVKDGYSPQEFYVEGSEQGPWSDLYSVAASLYHLISGAAPEEGQKRLSALAQKLPDPYEPLQGNVSGYTRGFLKTIDKSLHVVPQRRFQTADDWLQAIAGRPDKAAAPKTRDDAAPVAEKAPRPTVPAKVRTRGRTGTADKAPIAAETVRAALDNIPEESPEERLVRETLRQSAPTPKAGNPKLMMGVAAGAVVAVIGLAAVMFMGGGEDVATPVAEAEVPAPAAVVEVPETVVAERAPVPEAVSPTPEQIASLPVEPVLPGEPATLSEATQPLIEATPAEIAEFTGTPGATFPDTAETLATLRLSAITPRPRPAGLVPAPPEPISDVAPIAGALTGIATENPAAVASTAIPEVELSGVTLALMDTPVPPQAAGANGDAISPRPARVDTDTLAAAPEAARLPVIDTAAPAPLPEPVADGPLIAQQVQFSHWDVDMPFTADLERLRNANTAIVTGISDTADLSISGEWIAEGVTIYTFNGEKLMPDTPLSVHVLTNMNIDPDGYARSSVRYREAGDGQIDRGLLAVQVVRQIGLADGTILEGRVNGRDWEFRVIEFGAGTQSDLRLGDRIVAETSTGIEIATHEDFSRAFDRLVAEGIDTATFNVDRAGQSVSATYRLGRESGG